MAAMDKLLDPVGTQARAGTSRTLVCSAAAGSWGQAGGKCGATRHLRLYQQSCVIQLSFAGKRLISPPSASPLRAQTSAKLGLLIYGLIAVGGGWMIGDPHW